MTITQKKQAGFGLIEIILSLAIFGILSTGVMTFTVQTITETNRSSDYMQAIKQLDNIGYWLSRDVQMSHTVTPGPSSGFPLQLAWIDTNQDIHQVSYNQTAKQIQRSISTNNGTPSQMVVAQSFGNVPIITSCNFTDGLLTFNANIICGTSSVSRTYQIKPRPW